MIQPFIAAMLAAQISPSFDTGNGGTATIMQGRCSTQSITGTGPAGSDITKGGQPFRCSKAILTFFISRNRVLIQFINDQSRAGIVGFAGQVNMESREIEIDHMYLNDGKTLKADGGFCIVRGSIPKISSIVCASKITEGSITFGALIEFEAPKQTSKRRR